MECPDCNKNVGGISIKVGIVKVATFACPCGRHWRHRSFIGSPSVHDMVTEYEHLRARFPGLKSEPTKQALNFLQVKIESLAVNAAGKAKATREKAADAWERKFLREAIGEEV